MMMTLSSVSYWNDHWKELLLVISRDKIIRCVMRFYGIPVLIPRRPKQKLGKKTLIPSKLLSSNFSDDDSERC